MIRSFIELWSAVQTLLVQVATIKAEVPDDVRTIKRALTVYKQFLSTGLTDRDLNDLYMAAAQGDLEAILPPHHVNCRSIMEAPRSKS